MHIEHILVSIQLKRCTPATNLKGISCV